jgi:hypothetical protein
MGVHILSARSFKVLHVESVWRMESRNYEVPGRDKLVSKVFTT